MVLRGQKRKSMDVGNSTGLALNDFPPRKIFAASADHPDIGGAISSVKWPSQRPPGTSLCLSDVS